MTTTGRAMGLCVLVALASTLGCGSGPASTSDGGADAPAASDSGVADRCAPALGAPVSAGQPCYPVRDQCTGGTGCYYQQPTGGCPFECVATSGPGLHTGEPCQFLNDCVPGLACSGGVPGCTAMYCCTPTCIIGDPCTNGVTCRAFGITGPIPAGLETVGICANP